MSNDLGRWLLDEQKLQDSGYLIFSMPHAYKDTYSLRHKEEIDEVGEKLLEINAVVFREYYDNVEAINLHHAGQVAALPFHDDPELFQKIK